ncbi:MAG: hypothetical protein JJE50_08365 [Actinomycetales bacterium]|nr:hypothetical protein [Actinomycetales bacterium]
MVDPRWGRADWVAVADVVDGEIVSWREIEVSWSRLHDEGTSGSHHARVVTFLREHHVEAVVAHHIGDGMVRMLDTMGLPTRLGATGDARAAVRAVSRRHPSTAPAIAEMMYFWATAKTATIGIREMTPAAASPAQFVDDSPMKAYRPTGILRSSG